MRYLILGAGPAGLAFANRLKQAGETNFLIIEKEKEAGGLCRSVNVDKAPLDIGGGHVLDVRQPAVNQFLFSFMPETEWNLYTRDSRIMINDNMIGHPIEANIWQLEIESQVEYLKSIAVAGCNLGLTMREKFIHWIYWKLGNKIADDYMIPYNQKMFGRKLDQLGTYWLEKLPNVSFDETLLSCLNKKPYGQQPAHAQFYYPKKYGYGELWRRMADSVKSNIEYEDAVTTINFKSKSVTTNGGGNYKANIIINTIPWTQFDELIGMPDEIQESIKELKHNSIRVEYFPENIDSKAHWIYYPDPELPYHRILLRHNFCPGSRGYWTETNCDRVTGTNGTYSYINEYAYPLNTINKPLIMAKLLSWCKSHGVYGLGRWGEHQHYNSDVAVGLAMKMADGFTGGCRDCID